MTSAKIDQPDSIQQFLVAGNAVFTIVSKATGRRFTYCVRSKKDSSVLFVSLLTSPDTYSYIGIIPIREGGPDLAAYRLTAKSKAGPDAYSQLALKWFFKSLTCCPGKLDRVEFWHVGKCGRCGRPLTDPESISRGIGPHCITAV